MKKQYWIGIAAALLVCVSVTAFAHTKDWSIARIVKEIFLPDDYAVHNEQADEDESPNKEDIIGEGLGDISTDSTAGQTASSDSLNSKEDSNNRAEDAKLAKSVSNAGTLTKQAGLSALNAGNDSGLSGSNANGNTGSDAASDGDIDGNLGEDSKEDSDGNLGEDSEDEPDENPEEYPKVDKNPLAKNIEVLNKALWRERLNGNQLFFLPVKNFYFSSPKLTEAQVKKEMDSLVENVSAVRDITYVTTKNGNVNVDSFVTVYVEDAALFESRQAFDAKYEDAQDNHIPIEVELSTIHELQEVSIEEFYCFKGFQKRINSLKDTAYAGLQLEVYDFFLSYALKCNSKQSADTVKDGKYNEPLIYDYCEIPFSDIAEYFSSDSLMDCYVEYYNSLQTEEEKKTCLYEIASMLEFLARDMCFWLNTITVKDAQTYTISFSMFPVYETYPGQDGKIAMDKITYKTIATMAKEVDDKLNRTVEAVINENMSTLAKEYALLHYCDTFFHYDSCDNSSLGTQYAIYDNPYTVVSEIDSETGMKNKVVARISTQNEPSIYTVAMTGWGVCEGHAYFYEAVCVKAGIRCQHEEGEGHAWNVVRMNGKSYMVDAGRRAPYPHFNITHQWNDTYKVIDSKMHSIIGEDARFSHSDSPLPLYQAGYVADTTQQDGEWIYYINFDDNGSLYRVNVDGSDNEKICDSQTTLPDAYAWVSENINTSDVWDKQWEAAQYGEQYSGSGYTSGGAISYRWALSYNYILKKENGYIIYEVKNNPSVSYSVALNGYKGDTSDVTWYNNEEYVNLGIVSGYAVVDTDISPEDTIDKIIASVDGEEYPVNDVVMQEDGKKAEFTFRLPADRGLDHHKLDILVFTKNGGVTCQNIETVDFHPTGIKECFLWKDKYYAIEGIVSKEGTLTVAVKRYAKDGTPRGSANVLSYDYNGAESINVAFESYMSDDDKVFLVLPNGNCYSVILSMLFSDTEDYDVFFAETDNKVYLYSARGFLKLVEKINQGHYRDAEIEVCADLDFSSITDFKPIGTKMSSFNGTWKGNNYKIKGLNINSSESANIFGYIYKATIQDVYICDCNIKGANDTGVFGHFNNSVLKNLWLENVKIEGIDNVGAIAMAEASDIRDSYLLNVNISGKYAVGGICGNADNVSVKGIQVLGDSTIVSNSTVGGIVGLMKNESSIAHCLSEAEISTNKIAGGIVADINEGITISYCMNYGDITCKEIATGGIIGRTIGSGNICHHVENYGNVTAMSYAGGIVGYSGANVDTAVNGGSINANSYVGGIIGYIPADGSIRCCNNKGNVTGNSYTGQIAGSISKNTKVYKTLCTPWEAKITSSNISNMFGVYDKSISLLPDTDYIPYEDGRAAYCKYE